MLMTISLAHTVEIGTNPTSTLLNGYGPFSVSSSSVSSWVLGFGGGGTLITSANDSSLRVGVPMTPWNTYTSFFSVPMVTQLLPIILTRGRSTTALSIPKKQMLC
jgi:hypothetical protein